MTEQDVVQEAGGLQIDHALEHPDPDPETLPAVPPGWHPASQQAAEHLCRAVLRGRGSVEALQRKARQEAQAWTDMILVAEAQVDQQEGIIRDWMLKHEVLNLKTPWFTAYIKKATSRIVVNDEAAAIEMCKARGFASAVKVREALDKLEFDTYYNADPEVFGSLARLDDGGVEIRGDLPVAEEVRGEPSLVIRPRRYSQTMAAARPSEVVEA